jgi:hypothetical protein
VRYLKQNTKIKLQFPSCVYYLLCFGQRAISPSQLVLLNSLATLKYSSLEVYGNCKDQDCGQQIHQIGQVLAVESFTESSNFVLTSGQKVEQSDDSTFEFCVSASVDCRRAEGLPHDRFANVGGDKKRNTRVETGVKPFSKCFFFHCNLHLRFLVEIMFLVSLH